MTQYYLMKGGNAMSINFKKVFFVLFASFLIFSAVNVQPVKAYKIATGSTTEYRETWTNDGSYHYYYSPGLPAGADITYTGDWNYSKTYTVNDARYGQVTVIVYTREIGYEYRVY